MVFSSFVFLFLFLPIILLGYYVVPKQFRNLLLLLGSLFFYAWGEPVYIVLMILSIGVNYCIGRVIEDAMQKEQMQRARGNLIFAVVWNLAAIVFFKYYGFLAGSVNSIIPKLLPTYELSLPIGISFYTFQAISYIVDVYRKKVKAQKNIISFALYISMFPQLIAGPIVRYSDIDKEISERTITWNDFGAGCEYFIRGLAKKVLLANMLGAMFTNIQALSLAESSVLTAWIGALAYTFQIYFDFSGYSDMAIGLGRMFGFHFLQNFNYPYIASSITDFWRRWHISLSSWFKEYVYIPLGGNRCGTAKQVRNILVVWLLTGLWHGAGWNFICWGAYYGALLLLEKFALQKVMKKIPVLSVVYRIITFILVVIGWMIFANTSAAELFQYLGCMFGIGKIAVVNTSFWYYLSTGWVALLLGAIFSTPTIYRANEKLRVKYPMGVVVVKLLLFFLCVASLVYQSYNPFLYFRF